MELSNWFKGFEKGIAKLTVEQREQFFRLSNVVSYGLLVIKKTHKS